MLILAMDFLPRWMNVKRLGGYTLPVRDAKPCLLYADDSLFFVKPSTNQLQVLKLVLQVFDRVSGLHVNMEKLELLLTCSSQEDVVQCASFLECKVRKFAFTYLGIPLSEKKLPKDAYMFLIQKHNKRLSGCSAEQLSMTERLVLMKSVMSSISIYFMSVLHLSNWIIEEIDKIRRDFLWHDIDHSNKKMHLANWKLVCRPKKLRGLGVIDLKVMNQALLMK
jgi:hypothetical protein